MCKSYVTTFLIHLIIIIIVVVLQISFPSILHNKKGVFTELLVSVGLKSMKRWQSNLKLKDKVFNGGPYGYV